MEYSVDRIEEDVVVLLDKDGYVKTVELAQFAQTPSAGDIVQSTKDGKFLCDVQKTEEKRAQANALLQKLLFQDKK